MTENSEPRLLARQMLGHAQVQPQRLEGLDDLYQACVRTASGQTSHQLISMLHWVSNRQGIPQHPAMHPVQGQRTPFRLRTPQAPYRALEALLRAKNRLEDGEDEAFPEVPRSNSLQSHKQLVHKPGLVLLREAAQIAMPEGYEGIAKVECAAAPPTRPGSSSQQSTVDEAFGLVLLRVAAEEMLLEDKDKKGLVLLDMAAAPPRRQDSPYPALNGLVDSSPRDLPCLAALLELLDDTRYQTLSFLGSVAQLRPSEKYPGIATLEALTAKSSEHYPGIEKLEALAQDPPAPAPAPEPEALSARSPPVSPRHQYPGIDALQGLMTPRPHTGPKGAAPLPSPTAPKAAPPPQTLIDTPPPQTAATQTSPPKSAPEEAPPPEPVPQKHVPDRSTPPAMDDAPPPRGPTPDQRARHLPEEVPTITDTEYQHVIRELHSANKAYDEAIAELQEKEQHLRSADAALTESNARRRELQRDVMELQKQLSGGKGTAAEMQQLKERLAMTDELYVKHKKRLAENEEQLEDVQKELQETQAELRGTRDELQTAKGRLNDTEAEMMQRMEAADRQIKMTERELESMREQYAEVEEDRRRTQERLDTAQQSSAAATEASVAATNAMKSMKDKQEELVQQNDLKASAFAQEKRRWEQQEQQLREEMAALRSMMDAASAEGQAEKQKITAEATMQSMKSQMMAEALVKGLQDDALRSQTKNLEDAEERCRALIQERHDDWLELHGPEIERFVHSTVEPLSAVQLAQQQAELGKTERQGVVAAQALEAAPVKTITIKEQFQLYAHLRNEWYQPQSVIITLGLISDYKLMYQGITDTGVCTLHDFDKWIQQTEAPPQLYLLLVQIDKNRDRQIDFWTFLGVHVYWNYRLQIPFLDWIAYVTQHGLDPLYPGGYPYDNQYAGYQQPRIQAPYQSQFAEEVQTLMNENHTLWKQQLALEKSLEALESGRKKLRDLKEHFAEEQEDFKKTRRAVARERGLLATEREDVQQIRKTLEEDRVKLQQKITNLDEQMERKAAEIVAAAEHKSRLTNQLQEVGKEKENLVQIRQALHTTMQEHQAANAEVEKERRKVEVLEAELSAATAAAQYQERTFKDAKDTLDREVADAIKKYDDMKKEWEVYRKAASDAEIRVKIMERERDGLIQDLVQTKKALVKYEVRDECTPEELQNAALNNALQPPADYKERAERHNPSHRSRHRRDDSPGRQKGDQPRAPKAPTPPKDALAKSYPREKERPREKEPPQAMAATRTPAAEYAAEWLAQGQVPWDVQQYAWASPGAAGVDPETQGALAVLQTPAPQLLPTTSIHGVMEAIATVRPHWISPTDVIVTLDHLVYLKLMFQDADPRRSGSITYDEFERYSLDKNFTKVVETLHKMDPGHQRMVDFWTFFGAQLYWQYQLTESRFTLRSWMAFITQTGYHWQRSVPTLPALPQKKNSFRREVQASTM
mmetsp:Transcript_90248/g.150865  ORF Transcript_90248/g.150865 Transcript_90248/m.150865 type:complete len:1446 (+) Transcript_90248:96-4433(+)